MMTNEEITWRKVSFRKSSFSGSSGGNCVEVGLTGSLFGMRDSKNPAGRIIAVAADQGRVFLTAIKREQITDP